MIISGGHTKQHFSNWRRSSTLLGGLVLSLVVLFLWQSSSFVRPLKQPSRVIVKCDAETIKGDYFKTIGGKVKGAKTRTDKESYSGSYSSEIGNGVEFGFGYEMRKPIPGKAYRASVWMYRNHQMRGHLVVSAEDSNDFYHAVSLPVEKKDNGWELLRLHFSIPDIKTPYFKVYTFTTKDSPPIYFDDMLIEEIQPLLLPENNGTDIANIKIIFPEKSFTKLKKKELEARQKTILITEENDWVDGILVDEENREIPISARLKGDYLDHLSNNKWSFRIKTKGENLWDRLKSFSIQSPHTRAHLSEWVYHQMLLESDVLTPRYEFLHISINPLKGGIYAVEEHFEKYLVESKKRREGPILKLAEDGFWLGYKRQKDFYGDLMLGERMENAFWKSEIKPFKETRTNADPALAEQYKVAQNMLFAYKYQVKTASEVFDIDKLATMYAIMDLNNAYHGKAWHNQRFYYNPILSKLEPIGFDGYGDRPLPLDIPFMGYYFDHQKDFIPFYESPFLDSEFFRAYCNALESQTNPDSVQLFFQKYDQAIIANETMLQSEYPGYTFDREMIYQKARKIQALIKPYDDISLQVRTQSKNNEERKIEAYNKHCLPLDVVGYGISRDRMSKKFLSPIYVPQQVKGNPPKSVDLSIPAYAQYVFFSLAGTKLTYATPVSNLPGLNTQFPSEILRQKDDYTSIDFIQDAPGEVIIQSGQHVLNTPVIIPKEKQLIIEAGANVDFIEGAYILSFGPVLALGTSQHPIELFSSDQTARGFTVLQAPALSKFSHFKMDGFNTLAIEGWQLTGALTLYESNVEMEQCEVANNVCEDALNTIRLNFKMDHINIHHTLSDGFDADFCTGEIKNSVFSNTGNDGMDFSGSQITIGGTRIDNAGDKGISVGEDSSVKVWNAHITNSNIGVASKDLSFLSIFYIKMEDCVTGYAAYQKKPEFGPGKIEVETEIVNGNKYPYQIEVGSSLKIGQKVIYGKGGIEI